MPRARRPDATGAIHHVTQRGNDQTRVFGDGRDYSLYLGLLCEVATAEDWKVLSYCLMPNHVHVLLRTGDATLSRGMGHLHGRYANAYNRRRGGSGHVFQGRFHSRLVVSEAHLKAGFAYLALNPVRGGLVTHPDDWEWSAHGALAGRRVPFPRLIAGDALSFFHPDPVDGRRRYLRFVEQRLPAALEESAQVQALDASRTPGSA